MAKKFKNFANKLKSVLKISKISEQLIFFGKNLLQISNNICKIFEKSESYRHLWSSTCHINSVSTLSPGQLSSSLDQFFRYFTLELTQPLWLPVELLLSSSYLWNTQQTV